MALVGVAACGEAPQGDDGHDQLVPPNQGRETQGKELLGGKLETAGAEPGYHANLLTSALTADGRAVQVTFEGSASLRAGSHRGADPFFDGMVLTGAGGAQVRLTVARGGTDVAFYKLEGYVGGTEPWADLCPGGDAIPLAGKWSEAGVHEAAPDRFSFACAGAVAYKCVVWGFLPGGDPTSLGWRAHQACTRMARGDYCSTGHSHTREGTLIQIYDFAGVTSPPPLRFEGARAKGWPPDPDELYFEAAWNDGAQPASCLSRLRWQSLPLGPLCPSGELARSPLADTGAKFCEDLEWPDPGAAPTGALLFNRSAYSDLELHIWRDGTDFVSSVRGLHDRSVIQPFEISGNYVHVQRDGMLIRALREGVNMDELVKVYVFGKPGDPHDKVVAASPPPGFVNALGPEGFVRRSPSLPGAQKTVPFNLYYNATTNDYLSTAVSPPPEGYVFESTIGYVVPPEPTE